MTAVSPVMVQTRAQALERAGAALSDEAHASDRTRFPTIELPPGAIPTQRRERRADDRPRVAERGDDAEVEQLLAKHAAGELTPVPVDLPQLPGASRGQGAVAAFYALDRGLRLTRENDWPVPFGRDWVAAKTGLDGQVVGRILGKLVRAGVLVKTDPMPGRGGRKGTACYLPGPGTVERGCTLTTADIDAIRSAWSDFLSDQRKRRQRGRPRQLQSDAPSAPSLEPPPAGVSAPVVQPPSWAVRTPPLAGEGVPALRVVGE
jgi:hypothetical protein